MLADKVEQEETSPVAQSGDQSPSNAEELGEDTETQARITELEGLIAQKDEELAEVQACILELEQAVVDKDSDIAAQKQSEAELEERLSTVNDSLAEAIASYRTAVIQANPEVMAELVNGDTIESINESLEKAKSLISKVRQGLETEISQAKVPAGAPERRSPDLSALSPREKIKYAIGGRK